MPAPTQKDIRQSLFKLQKGESLFQQDIFNIAWGFVFHPDQAHLLLEIGIHNKKLAETLLVFRKNLRQAAATPGLETAIDQLYLHYVINTDGPIPEKEGEDLFDVFEAAARYAKSLCVEVTGDKDISIIHVNGEEKICPGWGVVSGKSAARSLRQVGPEINRQRYDRDDVIPSFVFGFNEAAEGHTLPNAMVLADFSHLAYFKQSYAEKQIRQWGYHDFAWINDPESDTQAFVAGKDGHVVISFRGTSSGTDALVDLNFLKTDAFGGRGRVHRGFQKALDRVWDQVQATLDNLGSGKKLFVCGHSLGAALAQLAAYRLTLGGHAVAGVYVFGSPRVGNLEFKEAYDKLLKDRTFLHINDSDIVTKVPPQILGFYYLGGSPRVFNDGHEISRPNREETEVPEKDFDDLDEATRDAIRQQMNDARTAADAFALFLDKQPGTFNAFSYETRFKDGAVDNHGKDQYLFKLGCAIVDSEWRAAVVTEKMAKE